MPRLIPAYRHPDPADALWAEWLTGGTPEDVIIINPNSGPGNHDQDHYATIVDAAATAGRRVIGYVPLGWADRTGRQLRPLEDIVRDAERYLHWYGVDGWFFDEAPNEEQHRRWVALLGRWALVGREGRRPKLVVFNAGTSAWWGLPAEVPGSVWVTHDGPAGPHADLPDPHLNIRFDRQAAIVYGAQDAAATEAGLAGLGWGWWFATTDAGPRGNPFDGDPTT